MRVRAFFAAACSLVGTGCATPPEIHDLAEKTAANVGIVSARMAQLSDESKRLYENRTDAVIRLKEANARIRADYLYDVALVKKTGEADDLDLVTQVADWGKEVDDIYAKAAEGIQQKREALTAARADIDAKTPALQKIAQTLSALAKQESTADRAKALRSFAVELRDDMKQQLDSGSQSAQDARALIDHVRGAVTLTKAN